MSVSVGLACGGSGEARSGPTEPDSPPAKPAFLTASVVPALEGNSLEAVWRSVPAATSYELTLQSPGAEPITTVVPGGDTVVTVDDLPHGPLSLSLRASNEAGFGPFSDAFETHSVDLRDVIEALFLGTGPLCARADEPESYTGACVSYNGNRWSGFPLGSTVRLIISESLGDSAIASVEAAAAQVEEATVGRISLVVERTPDPDPMPGTDEVTTTRHPDPESQGCGAFGCTLHGFREPFYLLSWSRAVQKDVLPVGFAHDAIGHGVLRMNHISGPLTSLMGGPFPVFQGTLFPELSPWDLAASRAVYSSGLDIGADATDFAAEGLINR